MKNKSTCLKANVKEDTFECQEIIYKSKNFIVALGKYNQKENNSKSIDMIAMRWIKNPEKNVENEELEKIGFPFNEKHEPVWLTVPKGLVPSLKEFFLKESKNNK